MLILWTLLFCIFKLASCLKRKKNLNYFINQNYVQWKIFFPFFNWMFYLKNSYAFIHYFFFLQIFVQIKSKSKLLCVLFHFLEIIFCILDTCLKFPKRFFRLRGVYSNLIICSSKLLTHWLNQSSRPHSSFYILV